MALEHLKPLTEEQRKEGQERRKRNTERLKKEAEAFIDFEDDMKYWESLASKYKIRLPAYYYPASELKYVRRTLSKLGLDSAWYLDHNGCSIKEMAQLNPTWNARAMCGLILEDYESEEKEKR